MKLLENQKEGRKRLKGIFPLISSPLLWELFADRMMAFAAIGQVSIDQKAFQGFLQKN